MDHLRAEMKRTRREARCGIDILSSSPLVHHGLFAALGQRSNKRRVKLRCKVATSSWRCRMLFVLSQSGSLHFLPMIRCKMVVAPWCSI